MNYMEGAAQASTPPQDGEGLAADAPGAGQDSGPAKLRLVSEPALDEGRIGYLQLQVAFHQQELREGPHRRDGMPPQQLEYHGRMAEQSLEALREFGATAVDPLLNGKINPLDPTQLPERD